MLEELSEELAQLDRTALRRRLSAIESLTGALVRIDGRELVCWCFNDYLGLSTHPALINAASDAAAQWGVGARASRLLAGTTISHERLEASLAAWFGAEAALVYSSGYLANLGTLGALLGPEDLVLVDRLAHASLIDAARATKARLRIFHHHDVNHLQETLKRMGPARRRLIVTEGIFSMEGDVAPLPELLDVAERFDATVYLDDAHGAFIMGSSGRGTPDIDGIRHERLLYMGTLGKALGCQGGFVIGPRQLIEYLHSRSRTFIYSTALAMPLVAAAQEALRVVEEEPGRRQHVHMLMARLSTHLHETVRSPILPLRIGSSAQALETARYLWDHGHWAPAIRPPTVPHGTARIRVSLTAHHTTEHVDALAKLLARLPLR